MSGPESVPPSPNTATSREPAPLRCLNNELRVGGSVPEAPVRLQVTLPEGIMSIFGCEQCGAACGVLVRDGIVVDTVPELSDGALTLYDCPLDEV